MHRVKVKPNVNINAFVASYYNSLSFAFGEILGRSYGGGVLELMPSEVERIILPYNDAHGKLLLEINAMFRRKMHIDDILRRTDEIILKKGFGVSPDEIELANNIWKKLSRRRLNRSK